MATGRDCITASGTREAEGPGTPPGSQKPGARSAKRVQELQPARGGGSGGGGQPMDRHRNTASAPSCRSKADLKSTDLFLMTF